MSQISYESQLDLIRRRLAGALHLTYQPAPSAEHTLRLLSNMLNLNLLSGLESRERMLARLYAAVTGVAYSGPQSTEAILGSLIKSPLFSILDGLTLFCPLASQGAIDLVDDVNGLVFTNINAAIRSAGPSSLLLDAASFVATSQQSFSLADTPAIDFTNPSGVTIALWHKATATPAAGDRIVAKLAGAGSRTLDAIWASTTAISIRYSVDGTNIVTHAGTPPTPTNWALYILIFNPITGVPTFRVNDALVSLVLTAGSITPGALFNSNTNLAIAAASGTPANWADMDARQLCIWNRMLTASECPWLYNNGLGRVLLNV